jgi:hypothetical protein
VFAIARHGKYDLSGGVDVALHCMVCTSMQCGCAYPIARSNTRNLDCLAKFVNNIRAPNKVMLVKMDACEDLRSAHPWGTAPKRLCCASLAAAMARQ